MKTKYFLLFLALLLIPFASAEIYSWNTIVIDNSTSMVSYYGSYNLDDTSASGIGKNKDVPIVFSYLVQALPYNLTFYGGYVDYCNFTITHSSNTYNSAGELTSTSIVVDSYYFGTGAVNSSQLAYNLRSRDYLSARMSCHYTNVSTLYVESIPVGRFDTFFPTHECSQCNDYTIEQQLDVFNRQDELIADNLEIYDSLQGIIDKNYELWLIASWIVKFLFLIIGLSLLVVGVMQVYKLLQRVVDSV